MLHPHATKHSAHDIHLISRETGTGNAAVLHHTSTYSDASERLRAEVSPAIVKILTDKSVGSGFFVDENGMVATVAHNVLGTKKITVETADHILHDAKIVKLNDITDVAELKVEMNGAKSKYLRLGSTASLRAGQAVSGFGFVGKEVDHDSGVFVQAETPLSFINRDRVEHSLSPDPESLKDFIQAVYTPVLKTSVRRVPGDSGGALVDDMGAAVGLAETQEPGVFGSSHFRKIEDFKDLVKDKTSRFAFDYIPDCAVSNKLGRIGASPDATVPTCKPAWMNHPPELYRIRRTNGPQRPAFDWLKIFPPNAAK